MAGNVGASAAPLAPAPYGTESGGSVIVVLADQHANLNGVVGYDQVAAARLAAVVH